MTARNDVTGDAIQTRHASPAYRDGWERIFGKRKNAPPEPENISPGENKTGETTGDLGEAVS